MATVTIQQALDLGVQHHQAGRLAEAEAIYRHILAVDPKQADALQLLGVIAHQVGRNDVAVDLFRQAISSRPDFPDAHGNLGSALRQMGQVNEAIAAYRQTIALQPGYAEAYSNLADALYELGRFDDAIAACRTAISLKPGHAAAHNNLGNALKDKGHLDEAIAAYRQAIALQPAYPQAFSNLGNALHDKRQLDEAIAACRQAVALSPALPEAHYNLGSACLAKGLLDIAIAAYRRAVALRPDYCDAFTNLGVALYERGQLEDSIAACRQAIALKPESAVAHSNLGNALRDQGRYDEAIAAYRTAIALKGDLAETHSNLVFAMNYHPGCDAEAIANEHRRWDLMHAEPLKGFIVPYVNNRTSERKLRIGYLSPDFRAHSVSFFLEGLLASHDPREVEVFCYSSVARPDLLTEHLRGLVPHWRDILCNSDEEAANLIRQDAIDILVDLAGHTADNRLLIFARKPAPVQVTWLGYPATTGLDAMDWRLTDALADPPGTTEHLHAERLFRLPGCAWCFRAADEAPPVSAAPMLQAGRLTFGCFNSQPKITTPMLRLWAEILLAVPGSRLLLKNRFLRDASTRQRTQAALGDFGIAAQRIELVEQAQELADHLATYSQVDIALDTFPYHGTTTTCEALWQGVPVITLAGKTHASRVGVSLLTNVGLSEFIATTPDEYVERAVALAADLPRLAALRQGMRARMQASPLMDAPRFARKIEAAYREIWKKSCHQTP